MDYTETQEELDPKTVVQGKTLDEWDKEGYLNENREPSEHVHPERPADREPTREETQAFSNSLTVVETLMYMLGL